MTIASPLRHPDTGSQALMTRRGWWLVALNLLLPGSAQVVAGNRRLGRLGLAATFLAWLLVIAGVLAAVYQRQVLLSVATDTLALWAAQVLLLAYAVLWTILTLDTLRMVRLVKLRPAARPAVALFAVALLVVCSGAAAYGSMMAATTRGTLQSVFQASQPPEPPVDGRYNIMLLGGDAGPDRQGMRPDSMAVASIDADTGQAVMIGLPRDLDPVPFSAGSPMRGPYPNGYGYGGRCAVDVCQLNSIYTEGELRKADLYPDARDEGSSPGIEAMRDALEGATGLTIQYYVLIDMAGFADLIDALGGVDIHVTERLPIGGDENLDNVHSWIEPGEQHMDGFTAEWYARSRHSTSDYDRMARQRQLQEAILRQMNPANVVSKFQAVAKAGRQVVKTDIPQGMLSYFVGLASKTRSQSVTNLELVPPTIDPTHPDYTQIHALVRKALADATPTPEPDSGG